MSSGDEEIALRADLKKNTGVTTTVSGDDHDHENDGKMRRDRKNESINTFRQWNDSDDKLADSSSEGSDRPENRWGVGTIRKTTQMTVSANRP